MNHDHRDPLDGHTLDFAPAENSQLPGDYYCEESVIKARVKFKGIQLKVRFVDLIMKNHYEHAFVYNMYKIVSKIVSEV